MKIMNPHLSIEKMYITKIREYYLIHENCPCKASPASYASSRWESTIISNDNHLMLLVTHENTFTSFYLN